MKKTIYLLALLFVLSACDTTNENYFKELDEDIEISYPSEAETRSRDFSYRLYTETDFYDEFGEPAIFAELTYIGDEDSIEIYHAASPFYFPLEERVRGFNIDYPMDAPQIVSTLKKGEPLREKYVFAGGYSNLDTKEYIEFVQTLINEGFPKGKYIINGSAQFYTTDPKAVTDEDQFNMNVTIGFTVNEGINQ